ncbi:MAG: glycosyltransferase family 4 protein [Lachnospiraceae bacterium]
MRVLWVCNIMLPLIADSLGLTSSHREGWLTGLLNIFLQQTEDNQIELGICFPISSQLVAELGHRVQGKAGRISYYGFLEDIRQEAGYDPALEKSMREIVADFKPDVVHIFGTEFAHALAMARVSDPDRTLVGIQGVCIACAQHYMDGIPGWVQRRFTLRDVLRQDNMRQQQRKFYVRARREEEILKLVGHVTGRTDLDRATALSLNPDIRYHFMNETLRSNFYESSWNLTACVRHRLLLSQGDYPLKGFHYMLQALPLIRQRYPDVTLLVAGNKITKQETIKDRFKISSYGKYLLQLIRSHQLSDCITFTGMVDSAGMCDLMQHSHIFVSPSTMENSPNSVGEAMLLGVPVVSSDVGGVHNLLQDEVDGLLYEVNQPDALAKQICRIFDQDDLALRLSVHAKEHAAQTHHPMNNYHRLLEIYQSMGGAL